MKRYALIACLSVLALGGCKKSSATTSSSSATTTTNATSSASGGEQEAGEVGVFGSSEAFPGSIQGKIYDLPEGTDVLPDFATLTPEASAIYADRWDVPARNFQEGFPGVSARFEWFALRYTGSFSVHTAGHHDFRITSDDGAKLLIDGAVVVDNDGVHGPQDATGGVDLTAGSHRVELQYFQGPATEIALQVFVTPPGGDERIFVTH